MTGLQQFIVALLGSGGVGGSLLMGLRVWWKGRTRKTSSAQEFRDELAAFRDSSSKELTAFKDSANADLAALKAELAAEKQERRSEFRQMSAALQAFRDRDGLWLELWHSQNVALSAAGLPVLQLPDRLRKWPEEITTATTSGHS